VKTSAIEKQAKQPVDCEGQDQPDKKPVALFASSSPDGQGRRSAGGHSIHSLVRQTAREEVCQSSRPVNQFATDEHG
jgi:hypothetical protein